MSAETSYLLDTNILLHYIRESVLYQIIEAHYHLTTLVPSPTISVVSSGEILSLARQFRWGMIKQQRMSAILEGCLQISLAHPGLVHAYAMIDAHNIAVGRSMGDNDVWIAATAYITKATLLTTDKDFDHLDPLFIRRDWIDPLFLPSEAS